MITRLGTYSQIKGSSYSIPCTVATTGAITLSGTQTIDGITVAAGNRVLVKNQGTGTDNGIYIVSSSTWTRAVDMSLSDDVYTGLQVYVNSGTANGSKVFVLTTANPIVLNSTALTFNPNSSSTSGTSGTSGVNGTSGTSGVNGTSGTSGVNGTSGSSGVNGTSGSSGVSPSITGLVPYTGATSNVTLGSYSLSAANSSYNYVSFNNTATAPSTISGYSSLTFITNSSLLGMNIKRADGQTSTLNFPNDGLTHQYDLPTTNGTIALTSQLSSYVPTSRTLSINGTSYDLSANRSWTVGTVTGSGTATYLPTFTSASAIGNSAITDDGAKVTFIDRELWLSNGYNIKWGTSERNLIKGLDSSDMVQIWTANGLSLNVSNGNTFVYALGTGAVYSNASRLTNTNPSDSRLKDNIQDIDWGLNELIQLRPVSFTWKNDTINQGKQYGFIAQEVKDIMPDLVREFKTTDGDEENVIRYGLEKEGINAALINAIKELNAKLDAAIVEIKELKQK